MKSNILSAAIVALGIVVLGLCMKGGMDNFTEKDRKVTVKGLAEREVKADKVTWPIVSKELGNDLPELYDRIAAKQRIIKQFLMSNGVSASEISVDAPKVIDMSADQYRLNQSPYRYNISVNITVTSKHVDRIRAIIARQGEPAQAGRGHRSQRLQHTGQLQPRLVQEDEAGHDDRGHRQRTADRRAVC